MMMPPDSVIANRRRHSRGGPLSKESIQRALKGWRRLREAWASLGDLAASAGNRERRALAEKKLEECGRQISRLESALERAA